VREGCDTSSVFRSLFNLLSSPAQFAFQKQGGGLSRLERIAQATEWARNGGWGYGGVMSFDRRPSRSAHRLRHGRRRFADYATGHLLPTGGLNPSQPPIAPAQSPSSGHGILHRKKSRVCLRLPDVLWPYPTGPSGCKPRLCIRERPCVWGSR